MWANEEHIQIESFSLSFYPKLQHVNKLKLGPSFHLDFEICPGLCRYTVASQISILNPITTSQPKIRTLTNREASVFRSANNLAHL